MQAGGRLLAAILKLESFRQFLYQCTHWKQINMCWVWAIPIMRILLSTNKFSANCCYENNTRQMYVSLSSWPMVSFPKSDLLEFQSSFNEALLPVSWTQASEMLGTCENYQHRSNLAFLWKVGGSRSNFLAKWKWHEMWESSQHVLDDFLQQQKSVFALQNEHNKLMQIVSGAPTKEAEKTFTMVFDR